ncbi:hypothetical protein V6N13_103515 [Hibiscus sabdariffa]
MLDSSQVSHLRNSFMRLRAGIDRFNWWACAAKERKRARRGSKPRKILSRMGEASRGVSRGLSLSLGSSSPSLANQVKNRAEAVATRELRIRCRLKLWRIEYPR